MLHCNSSNDVKEIFNLSCVRNVFVKTDRLKRRYDIQLSGPFTPGRNHSDKKHRSSVNYAQHIAEAKVYYDLAKKIGVTCKMPDAQINVGDSGPTLAPETVVMYTGSKPNWAMKRWDKYDFLASKFKQVMVVGKPEDINSHGNPTWIRRKWDWPDHVKFFSGRLREAAYLISQCKMFIGNDGGLAHVAAATGVPTFVLFGPSSDVKNKPYTSNSHVVAIDLPCRPCQFQKGPDGKSIFDGNKSDCPQHMKCMKEMSVDYVLNSINKIAGNPK